MPVCCLPGRFVRTALSPLIPKVLQWGRSYKVAQLKGDLLAACTIAAVAIPQGLAYAKLADVDPVHGTGFAPL